MDMRTPNTPRVRLNDATIVKRALNDSLQNMVTSMGLPGGPSSYTQFALKFMLPQELEAAYRTDWIARKVIDIPAYDATREWRNWQAETADISLIEDVEKKFNIQRKAQSALMKARLYGGSAIIIGVDQGKTEEPLVLDQVKKDSLKFVHAVSRYDIAAGPIEQDITSPYFGEPQYYDRTGQGQSVRLHPSRVVRFLGLEHPDPLRSDGWGDPILQVVSDAIKDAGTVSAAIAQLVNEAKLDVISIPDLTANATNPDYEAAIKKRFALAASMKSVWNTLLLDKEEQWQRIVASFASLPDILQMYMLIASGAADIPATRMLGQAPKGLSATGESDIRNYYDRVATEQKTGIGPALDRLDEVMVRSALGTTPDGVFYIWNSLWQMDEATKADIASKKATVFTADVNSGVLDPIVLKMARENQLIEDGTYPGLENILEEVDAMGSAFDPSAPDPNAPDPNADPNAAGGNANNKGNPPPPVEPGGEAGSASEASDAISDMVKRVRKAAAGRGRAKRYGDKKNPRKQIKDAAYLEDLQPRTLYVYRPVKNASAIIAWFKKQGVKTTFPANELHVTLAYSLEAVDWMKAGEPYSQKADGTLTIAPGGVRVVEKFADTLVLAFASSELSWRWCQIKENTGADWKWPDYQPHISITRNLDGIDPNKIEAYTGEIVLGPEVFEEVKPNAMEAVVEDAMWVAPK